jgi:hypothetical protein
VRADNLFPGHARKVDNLTAIAGIAILPVASHSLSQALGALHETGLEVLPAMLEPTAASAVAGNTAPHVPATAIVTVIRVRILLMLSPLVMIGVSHLPLGCCPATAGLRNFGIGHIRIGHS